MKHPFIIWIFLLSVGAILSGCKSLPAPLKALLPAEKKEIPGELLVNRSEAFAHYAAGVSYDLSDKSDLAFEEYYQSALSDPENEPLVLTLSQHFLQAKQNDKAIQLLLKTTSRSQTSGLVYAQLAQAYWQSGQTNKAIASGQLAIQKMPSSIAGYQILTEIYLQENQPKEAFKILEQAYKQANTDALFLVNLAALYSNYQRTQPKENVKPRGLEILNRVAALNPRNLGVKHRLADMFALFGEPKKAGEIYLKLIVNYQDSDIMRDTLREKLANIYLALQEKEKAAEQLQAIVRDNPTKYPQAYYVLGTLAYDEGKFEKAADYFANALLFNPDLEQAYYDLAGMQININQPLKALETLEKARAKFPKSFVAEFFSGLAHNKLKNYSEALKFYTAAEIIASATDPKKMDALFYFQIGAARERNREYAEAEKYFKKTLELSPEHVEALNYLGYMWAEQGTNLTEARELIEKAVKIEPKNAAYLDSLGWVYYKLNDPQKALSYLLKAMEFAPEPDPALFDHIGDIYLALKQPEKARESWQKSLSIEPNEEIKKKLEK